MSEALMRRMMAGQCTLRRLVHFFIRKGRRQLKRIKRDDPSLYKGTAFLFMVIIWLVLINMALPR